MDRFVQPLQELAPVDIVGLCLIAILVILGLFRGLWWQVIRLLGLCIAVAVARIASPGVAAWVMDAWPELSPRLAQGTAWLVVFLLALGAASLLGLLGQRILEAIQLGLANRIAGGLLGAVTGLVLHVAALVVLCQLGPRTFVERHVAGSHSERLVQAVGSRWRVALGAEASLEIDRLLHRASPAESSAGS
jgi:membrane protein required for colicin V production